MFAKFAAAILLAVSAVSALTVNTPTNVVTCQPIQLTWDATGATPPFILSVHDGNDPTGAALFTWTGLTGTSYTWNPVTIAGGSSLSLLIRDANGNSQQSAPFPVQAGTDTSCLNGVSSGGSSSVVGGSTPVDSSTTPVSTPASTPAGTSTTPVSTPAGSSTTPASSTSNTSKSSSGTSSSPSGSSSGTGGSGNGAGSNIARAGLVGVVGVVVAAALA